MAFLFSDPPPSLPTHARFEPTHTHCARTLPSSGPPMHWAMQYFDFLCWGGSLVICQISCMSMFSAKYVRHGNVYVFQVCEILTRLLLNRSAKTSMRHNISHARPVLTKFRSSLVMKIESMAPQGSKNGTLDSHSKASFGVIWPRWSSGGSKGVQLLLTLLFLLV